MAVADNLPIRTQQPVHSGKVRSVYWLSAADSARLIAAKGYPVAADTALAVMVISDRISAFECLWEGEGGLLGVPSKGAALNSISSHWFERFKEAGLARSHILDMPHPLVWIVQRAQPILIEAIARRYITGSLWRAYELGEREFCGIELPEGLRQNQRLTDLLVTPSTKGILRGIEGLPEADDVNVSQQLLRMHWQRFGFASESDIDRYESLLKQGFTLIETALAQVDQIFVDTKFEFGYAHDAAGAPELIYMDEVGTPDSSRIWDVQAYREGQVVERSKEQFRQLLLRSVPDPDVLLNKQRMAERNALARAFKLPHEAMMSVSATYRDIAEQITGVPLPEVSDPRAEIIQVLADQYQLITHNN